ncbi:MAG: P-II family nitrogen regulator [Solirubrobacteraceae bacterium]|jgi:nitrogen regulatory protein PII|nr:P-II family nitrogen regulator [Solirubrobacteraceae bacterium]
MSREGLTRMTKIEVVVEGTEAAQVRELLQEAGVTGYTAVSNVSGLGHHGYHEGRLLFNDQAALGLLIAVAPDDRVDAVLAGLRTLFGQRSGVVFVSDVWVSRAEYFTS